MQSRVAIGEKGTLSHHLAVRLKGGRLSLYLFIFTVFAWTRAFLNLSVCINLIYVFYLLITRGRTNSCNSFELDRLVG